jgi:DNA-directed RNA polymerase subunit omega
MARVSVEDCLEKVSNRFALVSLAAARTKQLYKGSKPRVRSENKEVVVALREVAAGKVRPKKSLPESQLKSLPEDKK